MNCQVVNCKQRGVLYENILLCFNHTQDLELGKRIKIVGAVDVSKWSGVVGGSNKKA